MRFKQMDSFMQATSLFDHFKIDQINLSKYN